MDIPSSYKQSIIDNRQNKINLTKSIIDRTTTELKQQLHDEHLGEGMVANALRYLGEAQIRSIADYAVRKGRNPGAVFVSICNKEIKAKGY